MYGAWTLGTLTYLKNDKSISMCMCMHMNTYVSIDM